MGSTGAVQDAAGHHGGSARVWGKGDPGQWRNVLSLRLDVDFPGGSEAWFRGTFRVGRGNLHPSPTGSCSASTPSSSQKFLCSCSALVGPSPEASSGVGSSQQWYFTLSGLPGYQARRMRQGCIS